MSAVLLQVARAATRGAAAADMLALRAASASCRLAMTHGSSSASSSWSSSASVFLPFTSPMTAVAARALRVGLRTSGAARSIVGVSSAARCTYVHQMSPIRPLPPFGSRQVRRWVVTRTAGQDSGIILGAATAAPPAPRLGVLARARAWADRIPKWVRISLRALRVIFLAFGIYGLGKAAGMAE
jgi:hypothetical protein